MLNRILETGLDPTMDSDDKRRLIFSNVVYLSVFVLLLSFLIISGGIFAPFRGVMTIGRAVPFLIIALALMCLMLNKFQMHLLSRIIFATGWLFFVSILPVILIGPSRGSYFTHSFFLVVFSPAIQLLFSYQKEKVILLFFLSLSFGLTLFSFNFLDAFKSSDAIVNPFSNNGAGMRLSFTIAWLFLNVLMGYVLQITWRFYLAVQAKREQVEAANNELKATNEELLSLNERVASLNNDLEQRVQERTRELMSKNSKLMDYAFMNAHHLRSPVSRIIGLIHLFKLTNNPTEKSKIENLLAECAQELDQVVQTMGKKLDDSH